MMSLLVNYNSDSGSENEEGGQEVPEPDSSTSKISVRTNKKSEEIENTDDRIGSTENEVKNNDHRVIGSLNEEGIESAITSSRKNPYIDDEQENSIDSDNGREWKNNGYLNDSDNDEDNVVSSCGISARVGKNYLLGATVISGTNNGSSEEEASSSDSTDEHGMGQGGKVSVTLDNPFRFFGNSSVTKEESVFQIPFREQEQKKSAALERHVKMTPMAGAVQMINGKKICWNYRKGKCRFGHNCTFAHDSDLQTKEQQKEQERKQTEKASLGAARKIVKRNLSDYDPTVVVCASAHLGNGKVDTPKAITLSSAASSSAGKLPDDFYDEEDMESSNKRKGKKRNGLSQNLVPGKKVMNKYYKGKKL